MGMHRTYSNPGSHGALVLVNQIQVHAHARADGQFSPNKSIKCLHLHLWQKYQANRMKNNVIVKWNLPKYNIFARSHVHTLTDLLF
jgi:hypothetical protein